MHVFIGIVFSAWELWHEGGYLAHIFLFFLYYMYVHGIRWPSYMG